MRFQLLPYEVEVVVEDERLAAKLAYLANEARQEIEVQGRLEFGVEGHGPYVLTEMGRAFATYADPDDVLYVLYGKCYERLLAEQLGQGWLPFHGGLVTIGGQRLLVVGQKGAGKTTLMLRLLFDGHDVEGDEMVFARDGIALALPRQFHVKPGTERLVPELAGRLAARPHTATSEGLRITGFDPAEAGFEWCIRAQTIDGAVVLIPNHGGTTEVRRLASVDLVHRVLEHAFPVTASRTLLLRAGAELVGQTDGIELTVGSLDKVSTAVVDFATLSTS